MRICFDFLALGFALQHFLTTVKIEKSMHPTAIKILKPWVHKTIPIMAGPLASLYLH